MKILVKEKVNFIMLMLIIMVILGCTTKSNREDFDAFSPKSNNWEDIFKEPANIKVEVWNTGTLEVPYAGIINVKDQRAVNLKDHTTNIDIPVFYLLTDRGSILIDAGLNKKYEHNKLKYIKGFQASKYALKGKDTNPIIDEITKRGIKLSYLFITHLHSDHIAGVVDIEIDFPVIIGKGEKSISYPLLYNETYVEKIKEFKELDFTLSKEIYPFKEVLDVFGDGSIFAIKTNGHSKGHISYLINSSEGIYLITGDQVSINKNIKTGVGPGYFSRNIKSAQSHFDTIMKFKSLYPEVKLLLSHEVNF